MWSSDSIRWPKYSGFFHRIGRLRCKKSCTNYQDVGMQLYLTGSVVRSVRAEVIRPPSPRSVLSLSVFNIYNTRVRRFSRGNTVRKAMRLGQRRSSETNGTSKKAPFRGTADVRSVEQDFEAPRYARMPEWNANFRRISRGNVSSGKTKSPLEPLRFFQLFQYFLSQIFASSCLKTFTIPIFMQFYPVLLHSFIYVRMLAR